MIIDRNETDFFAYEESVIPELFSVFTGNTFANQLIGVVNDSGFAPDCSYTEQVEECPGD